MYVLFKFTEIDLSAIPSLNGVSEVSDFIIGIVYVAFFNSNQFSEH